METKEKYIKAITLINTEQEKVVGPLVVEQIVKNVSGLELKENQIINLKKDDYKAILQQLVEYYSQLFGKASIEVSKEAIEGIRIQFTESELPDTLK